MGVATLGGVQGGQHIPIQRHGFVGGDGLRGTLLVATVRVGLAINGHDATRPGETNKPKHQRNLVILKAMVQKISTNNHNRKRQCRPSGCRTAEETLRSH